MKHDRFRNLEGEQRPDLQIDPRDARGRRAHIRCIECAHENGNYADACEKCHATLLTRAVHRLNVRLHQDEQAAELAQREAAPVVVVLEEGGPAPPVEQRTLLDRAAMRVGIGSLMTSRAIVVGAVAGACGLLYLATGWGAFGFVFGLVITLGLCLVAT